MPTYEWKCGCGAKVATVLSIAQYEGYVPGIDGSCLVCGGDLHRHYSNPPSTPALFQPHYNPSVGAYVSSPRDLSDKLKAASEQQSIRTGITHDYRPVDLRDRDRFNVTGDGLDETARRRHDAGMDTRGLDELTK